jgi:glutamate racemase
VSDAFEHLFMHVDLLAGTVYAGVPMVPRPPTVLVFDSGLGGLTVLSELRKARPDGRFIYAADDAGFPYGSLDEKTLVARVLAVMERLIGRHAPDLVVVACNTASTLLLPHLRARFDIPFVGTVPAIKPAAGLSKSKRLSVLGTPGTVARDYTRDLIQTYAGDCRVTLVAATRLAALAEAELGGAPASDSEIRAEIEPCFIADDAGRTDVVVLACTHYPLLLPRLRRLAPWPVMWIDPAPAIARRMLQLTGEPRPHPKPPESQSVAVFTGGAAVSAPLRRALSERGLSQVVIEAMPLAGLNPLTAQA